MNIKYEYRPDVRRAGQPKLLTKEEIKGRQGFTSIYGFDEDCCGIIEDHKGTWGLAGCNLYSDLLYIDIDKDQELIDTTIDKLSNLGISFTLYESGSPDSGHFHIPIVPMYNQDVPYIQKQWVSNYIGTDVDLSIYKTSGIIRIAGSYHKKHAGHKKQEILAVSGNVLDLTTYETVVKVAMPRSRIADSDTDYNDLLDSMLMTRVYRSNRNNELFKRAAIARDAGYDLSSAIDIMQAYNNSMVSPPAKSSEVISTVKSAYRSFK